MLTTHSPLCSLHLNSGRLHQMHTLGLESVLVGHVLYPVQPAVGAEVLVHAVNADLSRLRVNHHRLLLLDAVAGREAEVVAAVAGLVVGLAQGAGFQVPLEHGGTAH